MEYKHFSHQHPLTVHHLQPGQQFTCHGCNHPCTSSMIFACWPCNFFLHDHCGNSNRYVKHPAHPAHPLVLLPTPTYCSSSFLCNACGAPGSSFSYTCALCEVDLHVPCAYLPPTVRLQAHPHELHLSVRPVPKRDPPMCCADCRKELDTKCCWYYFCDKPECNFRVHTFCATTEVKPGLYQDDEPDAPVQAPAATQQDAVSEEALAEMFQIQMQLEMAHQLNQFINAGRVNQ